MKIALPTEGGGRGSTHPKKTNIFVPLFTTPVRLKIMIFSYSNSKKVEFQLLNMSWYTNL